MISENLISQFQYVMMTIILLSITDYIFISYKNIGKKIRHINSLVQQIINTSLLSIFYSALLILRGLVLDNLINVENPEFKFAVYSIAILCFFLIIGFSIIWSQHKSGKLEKFNIAAPLIIVLISMITPFKYFNIFYYISVILFILISTLFFYKAFFKMKMKFNSGIYYITGGAIVLILSTSFSLLWGDSFFNIFSLGIMSFIMLGIFLFFVTYFISELEHRVRELKQRDRIIKDKDERIEFIAFHDDITKILNQSAFERDITNQEDPVYLCLFNIHNFKSYNNLLGFNRGNEILKSIAKLISEAVPEDVTIYRFYSDKFLVKFSDYSKKRTYDALYSIIEVFKKESFQGINLDAYFGLFLFKNEIFSSKTDKINFVINSLEIASSVAKEEGKYIYEYSSSDNMRFTRKVNMEIQLKKSIVSKDFMMYYQPQVNLKDLEICSYEALIRWKYNNEFVSPSEFIPLAETKGLMGPITKYVINQVFSDISNEEIFLDKRISINLSTDQLVDDSFLNFIETACINYPVDPRNIVFEITETSLFNDVDKINETISGLKKFGFQISLDDFGIGYSSIFRFSKLDIDEIKFDKAFVSDLENYKTYNTVNKTAELFRSLNMRIIFEGVETKKQMEILKFLPIDVLQGFLFYRPMPIEKIKSIIK